MATRVGPAKIRMTLFDWLTPKNLGPMLNLTRFLANVVWKFADFRYHGNRGWSDTKYTFI